MADFNLSRLFWVARVVQPGPGTKQPSHEDCFGKALGIGSEAQGCASEPSPRALPKQPGCKGCFVPGPGCTTWATQNNLLKLKSANCINCYKLL